MTALNMKPTAAATLHLEPKTKPNQLTHTNATILNNLTMFDRWQTARSQGLCLFGFYDMERQLRKP